MRVVLLRHAEPLVGRADPPLSPAGQRMADAAGDWVSAVLGAAPVGSTATARTAETAARVAARTGAPREAAPLRPPEDDDALDLLLHLSEAPRVCVVHHPTLEAAQARFRPHGLWPRAYCAGVLLTRDGAGVWRATAVYPGHPPG
jgi:phosphohistidine phosphatase SixA